MPRTARRRRTLRRRVRTIAVLAVASGGTAAWLVTHNHSHRVKTVPAAAVSELVIPGLERLPDLVPVTTTTTPATTTTVTAAAPVYHPPAYEGAASTSTTVARAVPPSGSPVRATTTTTMAPTTTTRAPVVTASAAITSCGPYPFTACIPPVGNPAVWSCIISRESGGNPRAVGRLGEGGIFQLMVGTAAGLGFPPLQFQPISVQIRAATALYLQRGFQPWSPSDGC